MNWIWISMLMEAIAKILQDCPESSSEKRRARLFDIARNPRRLGGRKLLKAIRQTPLPMARGSEKLEYPKGRKAIRLLREMSLAVEEMTDDELRDNIAIVDEIYEEDIID